MSDDELDLTGGPAEEEQDEGDDFEFEGDEEEETDIYDYLQNEAREKDSLLPEIILDHFDAILSPNKETQKILSRKSADMRYDYTDMARFTGYLEEWVILLHRQEGGQLSGEESNSLDRMRGYFDLERLQALADLQDVVSDTIMYNKEALSPLKVPQKKFNPPEAGQIIKSIWRSSRKSNPTVIAISAANQIMNELGWDDFDVNFQNKKLTTPVLQSALNYRSGREITTDAFVAGEWRGKATVFSILPGKYLGESNVKAWINYLWNSPSWRRIAGVDTGEPKPFPKQEQQEELPPLPKFTTRPRGEFPPIPTPPTSIEKQFSEIKRKQEQEIPRPPSPPQPPKRKLSKKTRDLTSHLTNTYNALDGKRERILKQIEQDYDAHDEDFASGPFREALDIRLDVVESEMRELRDEMKRQGVKPPSTPIGERDQRPPVTSQVTGVAQGEKVRIKRKREAEREVERTPEDIKYEKLLRLADGRRGDQLYNLLREIVEEYEQIAGFFNGPAESVGGLLYKQLEEVGSHTFWQNIVPLEHLAKQYVDVHNGYRPTGDTIDVQLPTLSVARKLKKLKQDYRGKLVLIDGNVVEMLTRTEKKQELAKLDIELNKELGNPEEVKRKLGYFIAIAKYLEDHDISLDQDQEPPDQEDEKQAEVSQTTTKQQPSFPKQTSSSFVVIRRKLNDDPGGDNSLATEIFKFLFNDKTASALLRGGAIAKDRVENVFYPMWYEHFGNPGINPADILKKTWKVGEGKGHYRYVGDMFPPQPKKVFREISKASQKIYSKQAKKLGISKNADMAQRELFRILVELRSDYDIWVAKHISRLHVIKKEVPDDVKQTGARILQFFDDRARLEEFVNRPWDQGYEDISEALLKNIRHLQSSIPRDKSRINIVDFLKNVVAPANNAGERLLQVYFNQDIDDLVREFGDRGVRDATSRMESIFEQPGGILDRFLQSADVRSMAVGMDIPLDFEAPSYIKLAINQYKKRIGTVVAVAKKSQLEIQEAIKKK